MSLDARPTDGLGEDVAASRRRLLIDGATIATYAVPVGLVYGLAARDVGFSLLDTFAASVLVLAGGAQFAAVGLLKSNASWAVIVGVTALLNARHLLYSAALAPFVAERPRRERAAMAHFLTDETFALALAHFRRIAGFDGRGYWLAASLIFFPWTVGSVVGFVAGQAVTNPATLGLDVLFPTAMAGLAVGMMSGRREVVAACGAVAVAVLASLVSGTAVGLVAGAVVGPLIGMAMPGAGEERVAIESPEPIRDHLP